MFKCVYLPLEQLIAELGEVLEEEVPLVRNYLTMRPVVAVNCLNEQRKKGIDQCPQPVVRDPLGVHNVLLGVHGLHQHIGKG